MPRKTLTLMLVAVALAGGAALSLFLQRRDGTATPGSTAPPAAGREAPGAASPAPRTPHLAGTVIPPGEGRVYWGAFRQDAPYRRERVAGLEAQAGERPSILMWYQEWEGRPLFDVRSARWLQSLGIVPMVTWEPWKPPSEFGRLVVDQPEYSLRRIAEGAFDDYVAEYALAILEFGGPVMLRPFHEMDGFWYPWGGLVNGNTPEDFVAAWRRIHGIFEELGATNVTWVWSVNHRSVPDTPENAIRRYWPGSGYVDWVGVSGFNWGQASDLSVWRDFDGVYLDRYRDVLGYGKPIVLTEMGAPEVGGDKAAWIAESFAGLDRYPEIKAVIWYDKRDSDLRDWRFASSPDSLQAFRAAVAAPTVLSAPSAAVAALGEA